MKIKLFCCLLVCANSLAFAAELVPVFNLPLGGKLKAMPHKCPLSAIGDDNYKALCWIDEPYISRNTGMRLGRVQMPNSYLLPKWAATASFDMDISKHGMLERIKIISRRGGASREIAESIGGRFGAPTKDDLSSGNFPHAVWNLPNIYIDLLCNRVDICAVEFMSPQAKEAWTRDLENRKKKEQARSATP